MTLLQEDPTTQLAFSLHENKGVFAVLLGSGVSRSAEIPTGWEITLDLVRRVAAAQGAEEPANWADWYRKKTGQEPNYSDLLEEIASSPDERRAILHRYIEPDDEDREKGRKIPTPSHLAIAKLVRSGHVKVIVTTNFDRLMERALRDQGIEPTVVSSVDSLQGAEPITHSQCYLFKLHGDYKDARILNTDRELKAYPEEFNHLLDRIFDEYGLVICGWSGEWDHALRKAIYRTPSRRYPLYWAARSALQDDAADLAAHRGAKIIRISSADDFFVSLQTRVETLENARRQNPISVELLVSTAKRYLTKPEYRINLDELFSQEMQRLLLQLDGPDFEAGVQWDVEKFKARVRLYESLTEPLARMAGALGRWGDDSEFELILDVLKSICAQSERVGGGLTVFLKLRSYPAVLVFTAYGVGLTKALRWSTLYRLFSAPVGSDRHDPKRIVSTLFLWSWSGWDKQLWQNLDGMDRRKTPLSDHLLDLMQGWKTSFIGVEPDFELLFERFEMLASLASLDDTKEEDLEKAATQFASSGNVMAWMPVGRSGWHSSAATALMQEFGEESVVQRIVAAGFAGGSRRFLQLFIENFNRYVRRMSWE